MKILVCGDREWGSYTAVGRELDTFMPWAGSLVVIHGGCRGADSMAGMWAKENGVPVMVFEADWGKHGKAAGPIRNRQMLNEGEPDYVLAFHRDLNKSKGTKDMVMAACAAGIPVRIFPR
jgi:hypothetical protein